MSSRFSDWKLACIPAVVLLGLALALEFGVHPGGFETQNFWFVTLLPGAIVAFFAADYAYRVAPWADPVVFWSFAVGFSFFWYWVISYAVIKIRRALSAL
jgi:hypothetical protein